MLCPCRARGGNFGLLSCRFRARRYNKLTSLVLSGQVDVSAVAVLKSSGLHPANHVRRKRWT